MSTIRFGVSMDSGLVSLLDTYVQEQGLANRSEALRTLVRRELIQPAEDHEAVSGQIPIQVQNTIQNPVSKESDDQGSGILSLLYPRGLTLQRVPIDPFPSVKIISNLKLHLSEETLMSILVVQGQQKEIMDWIKGFHRQKGVLSDYSLFSQSRITEIFQPCESDP